MGKVLTRVPLTTTGAVVVGLGLVAYIGGWQLGWVELMVVAAGCLCAMLVAAPFVAGRLRLDVTRVLDPERVVVGDAALAVLRVRNDTDHRIAPRLVEERVGDRIVQIEVPGLAAGATSEGVYHLPTERRGRYQVGPAVVVKADPLGLLRREVVQQRATTFWVHPRHRLVRALAVGFAKDLEGPTSDTSPQGDVAFHAIREYQPGDDYRHIHWLSTARTGTVMVRHYVDNRVPHLGVLLDVDASAYVTPDHFERAVEAAASLGVSALVGGQPVALHVGDAVGAAVTPTELLDRLAVVQTMDSVDLGDEVAQLVRRQRDVSAVAIITGPRTAEELLAVTQRVRRTARILLVRVVPDDGAPPVAVPGARVLDVRDLDEFTAAWNRVAA